MNILSATQRSTATWIGMVLATSGILVLAVLPPWLPPEWRVVVMRVFAPVCHQMPGRSPMLEGVQIALCDRCAGIYAGCVFGTVTVWWGRTTWRRVESHVRYVLLGSLVPLGLDWVGPVLGLWSNLPMSRAITGMLFGSIAASFTADRVLGVVERTRANDGK